MHPFRYWVIERIILIATLKFECGQAELTTLLTYEDEEQKYQIGCPKIPQLLLLIIFRCRER